MINHVLHFCEQLTPGGMAKVMVNLAALHTHVGTSVVGVGGDTDYRDALVKAGFSSSFAGDDLNGLDADLSQTAVVIHRGGGSDAKWNRWLEIFRKRNAPVIIEFNHFGYADTGAGAGLIDFVYCVSQSALLRNWRGSGRPEIDSYLQTHAVLYNPVLPPPTNMSKLRRQIREEWGLQSGDFVVGCLFRPDRMRIDSMIPDVLRSFTSESRVFLAARQFPPLLARKAKRILGSRFIDLPFKSGDLPIWQTLAAIDCFAHFSSMGESFGMAIAEAMRAGLPVITSTTPWSNCSNGQIELVRHQASGMIVDTPSETRDGIEMLRSDPKLCSRMGESGRNRFLESALDPQQICLRLEQRIISLVAKKKPEMAVSLDEDEKLPPADLPDRESLESYIQHRGMQDDQSLLWKNRLPYWMHMANLYDGVMNARRLWWRVRRRFS